MERPICTTVGEMEAAERIMSLLTEAMEQCVLMDKSTVDDGYGGYISSWTDGAKFKAAMTVDNSTEAMTAQAAGVTAMYTVTTEKQMNLQYHDVFRRLSDGKIFRVKTDGDDVKTPSSAGLNMRQVRAEEWVLPNG